MGCVRDSVSIVRSWLYTQSLSSCPSCGVGWAVQTQAHGEVRRASEPRHISRPRSLVEWLIVNRDPRQGVAHRSPAVSTRIGSLVTINVFCDPCETPTERDNLNIRANWFSSRTIFLRIMTSSHLRRILWYSAWLVWLPVTGYGISSGNLLIGFVIGTPLFIASLYFSLEVRQCPSCGYSVRVVSTAITHCLKCGTAYDLTEIGESPSNARE